MRSVRQVTLSAAHFGQPLVGELVTHAFLVALQTFIPFIKLAMCHRSAFLPGYPWANTWFRRGPARSSGHGPECVVVLEYCLSFLPLPWSCSIQQELYQKWIVKAFSRYTIFRQCPCNEGHPSLCSIVTHSRVFRVKSRLTGKNQRWISLVKNTGDNVHQVHWVSDVAREMNHASSSLCFRVLVLTGWRDGRQSIVIF